MNEHVDINTPGAIGCWLICERVKDGPPKAVGHRGDTTGYGDWCVSWTYTGLRPDNRAEAETMVRELGVLLPYLEHVLRPMALTLTVERLFPHIDLRHRELMHLEERPSIGRTLTSFLVAEDPGENERLLRQFTRAEDVQRFLLDLEDRGIVPPLSKGLQWTVGPRREQGADFDWLVWVPDRVVPPNPLEVKSDAEKRGGGHWPGRSRLH
ncbi:hypothetical protein Afil01_29620 [Actinorhabdospora filicis]|uniref:Uncharacterized protein n=1 Tax=Actinorhabdospora filicis TaxID=1785913 RepID=A0A9W6WAY6_9ACTN|nr:hypothetical protein [Actinorhabdospora filicis]GLZ78155.1 hypothetical protein Afil01_29620 [Actinorhabdospora filicis]